MRVSRNRCDYKHDYSLCALSGSFGGVIRQFQMAPLFYYFCVFSKNFLVKYGCINIELVGSAKHRNGRFLVQAAGGVSLIKHSCCLEQLRSLGQL